MKENAPIKCIDLTPRLRRNRRLELVRTALSLWTQYLSLGALALYGLLRPAVCPQLPPGDYRGPLVLLWPASYILLLISWAADTLVLPALDRRAAPPEQARSRR